MGKRGPKPFGLGDCCRSGHRLTQQTVTYQMNSGIRRMRCLLCLRAKSAALYRTNHSYARKAILRSREWYRQNSHKESFKARRRRYDDANRARARVWRKRWATANPERVRAYFEANRERLAGRWTAHWKSQVINLGDSYIAQLVSSEVIEAKRLHLQAKRLLQRRFR